MLAAEADRLSALDSFGILDTPPETVFDDLTDLAAHVSHTPMAAVSFVDAQRSWFKSRHGLDLTEMPRELSFCAYTLEDGASVLHVHDTELDPRFSAHPMVTGEPRLRFYAGAPLVTAEGQALGTLCVMDVEPRILTTAQRRYLKVLANQVVSQLELRRRAEQFASEVDARLAADAALREQQLMLEGVLKHTDVLIYAKDVYGRFVMANPITEYVTHSPGGMIGKNDYELYDTATADSYRRHDADIMATRQWRVFSEELLHRDGTLHTYRSTKFPLIDDNGNVIGIGGVSTDVTELAAARAAHAEAEQRWRRLVEQSPAAVVVVDSDGMLAYVNPEAVALYGASAAGELESRPALILAPPAHRAAAQSRLSDMLAGGPGERGRHGLLLRADGTELPVEFNATPVEHAGAISVQLEMRDISATAAMHAALKQSATTDPLTGLLNRRAWDAQVRSVEANPRYAGAPMTVAVIDLDNFKSYNDTRGHTAGDNLLQLFATVAGASLGHDDVFARWGGEEFILALPGATTEQAEGILNRVSRCVPSGQTCSIGYTARIPSEELTETVIRADKALYQAKVKGRDQLWLL